MIATILTLVLGMGSQQQDLSQSLSFHAPFDTGLSADRALGDPNFYQAANGSSLDEAAILTETDPSGPIQMGGGIHGEAMHLHRYNDSLYFFKGQHNVPYMERDWEATISFWLRIDPDEDLAPGQWSDPVLVTASAWDDGAIFVDFTRQVPRSFRFAAFADRGVWNPDNVDWQTLAPGAMPMITVADHPFSGDEWIHVVMTIERFNTGEPDGVLTGYLNGEAVGTLEDRMQTISWKPEDVRIQMGLQFIGGLDELALFDRALTAEEVRYLFELPNGINSLN